MKQLNYCRRPAKRVDISINMEATGANIRKLRKERNLSVADLQEFFGFEAPQAIYKWMRGDTMPTIDNIVVLADVLGVEICDIIAVCRKSV